MAEGFLAYLGTVAMDLLIWCVTVLALITSESLAARSSLAILVLLERVMTFWTFHMPILHINLATPQICRISAAPDFLV